MDRPAASRRPFLTARWENLILANFAVPDDLLLPRLPRGLDLDRWEGRAFVSLVAFEFRNTRVFGISWPGYRDFPEINLRFYVRRGSDRGVIFIREIVGLRLVARIARWVYNEPYRVSALKSFVTRTSDVVEVEHRLPGRDRVHTIRATGSVPAIRAAPDNVEHFFKEQRWGFGQTRRGATLMYEVDHPLWATYPVRSFSIDLDWDAVYGPEWGFLTKATPASVILAAGSPVSVYRHRPV
jgi:uncharacterized protein YqjF (DUF2071 family)